MLVDATKSYLQRVSLSGSRARTEMHLAYPTTAHSAGCINVVCGPNNAGKTFLLERVRFALSLREANGNPVQHYGVSITLSGESRPLALFCGKNWREKSRAGNVNVSLTKEKLEPPGDVPEYRKSFLRFLWALVNDHLPSEERCDWSAWVADDVRKRIAARFSQEDTIYLCDQSNQIVQTVQLLLDATLYFRRAHPHQFDFVLAYADGTRVCFPEWSDGQQLCFYLAVLIITAAPDILLLDELENHLHPAYMSRLLLFVKERVGQTVISTHHPHIIFSEYVDRVFYLEAANAGHLEQPRRIEQWRKHQYQSPPKRTATLLEDRFEKITGAYRLFDQQDAQLMKQAARIASEADFRMYRALYSAFAVPTVVAGTNRPLPDTQTQQLIDRLREFVQAQRGKLIRILDFGAGLGRVALEAAKVSEWQVGCQLEWICWEPDGDRRSGLGPTLAERSINALVPKTLDEVPTASADIVLIGNLLHELPVERFVTVVRDAFSKVAAKGRLIILEMFPLLSPEQFAVPYPASTLLSLLRHWDIHGHSEQVAIRGGLAQAYCILAVLPKQLPPTSVMQSTAQDIWCELERAAVSAYSSRSKIASAVDYTTALQELTTLASIAAWRCGIWK